MYMGNKVTPLSQMQIYFQRISASSSLCHFHLTTQLNSPLSPPFSVLFLSLSSPPCSPTTQCTYLCPCLTFADFTASCPFGVNDQWVGGPTKFFFSCFLFLFSFLHHFCFVLSHTLPLLLPLPSVSPFLLSHLTPFLDLSLKRLLLSVSNPI
jgi:hypothetical protein